jgi:hypothetical protein
MGFISFEYQKIGVDTAKIRFWFTFSPIEFAFGNFLIICLIHTLGLESMAQIGGLLSIFVISLSLFPSLINKHHPILTAIPSFFGFPVGFVMFTLTMSAIPSPKKIERSVSGIAGTA